MVLIGLIFQLKIPFYFIILLRRRETCFCCDKGRWFADRWKILLLSVICYIFLHSSSDCWVILVIETLERHLANPAMYGIWKELGRMKISCKLGVYLGLGWGVGNWFFFCLILCCMFSHRCCICYVHLYISPTKFSGAIVSEYLFFKIWRGFWLVFVFFFEQQLQLHQMSLLWLLLLVQNWTYLALCLSHFLPTHWL